MLGCRLAVGPRTQTLTSIVRNTDLARQRVDTWRALVVGRVQTVRELLEEYGSGLLSGAELSSSLLQVLAGADIDAQLAEVPPDALDWVLWELRDNYAPIVGHDPASYMIIEGVTVLPGKAEEYRLDFARREERMRTLEIPWVQRWLEAHPLPAREPFSGAVVQRLHARVEASREALWASRPSHLGSKQWRSWSERELYEVLGRLEIELDKSLRRAALGGPGSQEQALAWEGLERVAHLLAAREDLTVEEREVVVEAGQRRGARRGSFRP